MIAVWLLGKHEQYDHVYGFFYPEHKTKHKNNLVLHKYNCFLVIAYQGNDDIYDSVY